MTLQTRVVSIDVGQEQPREVPVVYVHRLELTTFRDDAHPTAFLHWAAVLPKRCREFHEAKLKGRSAEQLQVIKRIILKAADRKRELRLRYRTERVGYLQLYLGRTMAERVPTDLIVCCPSTREDASFYSRTLTDALRRVNPGVLDLSEWFSKKRHFKAGAATPRETRENILFRYAGCLAGVERVLIVDDVWATGGTVGAVLYHLMTAGLRDAAVVTVFAPLLIPPREPVVIDGCET